MFTPDSDGNFKVLPINCGLTIFGSYLLTVSALKQASPTKCGAINFNSIYQTLIFFVKVKQYPSMNLIYFKGYLIDAC